MITETVAVEVRDAIKALHQPSELTVWVWTRDSDLYVRVVTADAHLTLLHRKPPDSRSAALKAAHALIPVALDAL